MVGTWFSPYSSLGNTRTDPIMPFHPAYVSHPWTPDSSSLSGSGIPSLSPLYSSTVNCKFPPPCPLNVEVITGPLSPMCSETFPSPACLLPHSRTLISFSSPWACALRGGGHLLAPLCCFLIILPPSSPSSECTTHCTFCG